MTKTLNAADEPDPISRLLSNPILKGFLDKYGVQAVETLIDNALGKVNTSATGNITTGSSSSNVSSGTFTHLTAPESLYNYTQKVDGLKATVEIQTKLIEILSKAVVDLLALASST